jgi:IS5 family transposase
MKITTRCGEQAVHALNDALLAKAVEAKVLKLNRVRADTTVIEANVAYPVDSSLLAKGVARPARLATRAHGAGLATRTRVRDRSRSVYRRARDVVNTMPQRGDLTRDKLRRLNTELAAIARRTVTEADALVRNARRTLARRGDRATGRQRAIVDQMATLARRVAQVRPRPNSASWTVSPLRAPPGSCRCMTPMPAPSPRVVSVVRSSSATRRSWSTTTTA